MQKRVTAAIRGTNVGIDIGQGHTAPQNATIGITMDIGAATQIC